MKNFIIPALTLLIGLAMGALLWKNIDPPSKQSDEEAIQQVMKLYSNQPTKSPDGKETETLQLLNQLTEQVSGQYFAFDCRPKEDHKISVKDAAEFVDNYIKFPSSMVKHTCPSNGGNDCTASQRLQGWRVSYQDIIDLSDNGRVAIDNLYLALGRHDEETGPGALTLIIAPLKDNNLLLEDNRILEFMRPCPPRCPDKVNGQTIDPCTFNPFRQ